MSLAWTRRRVVGRHRDQDVPRKVGEDLPEEGAVDRRDDIPLVLGSAVVRGAITGGMTTLGGLFHTLPFIISNVHRALVVAGIVVAVELITIAWIRKRFFDVSMRQSLLVVTVGGAIVLAIGVAIGSS